MTLQRTMWTGGSGGGCERSGSLTPSVWRANSFEKTSARTAGVVETLRLDAGGVATTVWGCDGVVVLVVRR